MRIQVTTGDGPLTDGSRQSRVTIINGSQWTWSSNYPNGRLTVWEGVTKFRRRPKQQKASFFEVLEVKVLEDDSNDL